MGRFDVKVEIPPVEVSDLSQPPATEGSAEIAFRVAQARDIQKERFAEHVGLTTNSDAEGTLLEQIAEPTTEGRKLLHDMAQHFRMSARAYHRILRVSRTIADLEGETIVQRHHIAESVSYRFYRESASGRAKLG